MSDTDHAAAIRATLHNAPIRQTPDGWEWVLTDDDVMAINRTADALAAALEAERARSARLRAYATKLLEEIGALCEPPGESYWVATEASGEAMAHYHEKYRRILRKGDLDPEAQP